MAETETYKIAFIDIETAPSLGFVWEKWETDVLKFEKDWYILSFSVKWANATKPETYALCDFPGYSKDPEDDKALVTKLWEVLDKADLVVAHNGDAFDCKKANARFIYHNLKPPAPYRTVDTLKVARKYFKFTSNKLDDLAQYLKLGSKIKTGGFDLWLGCIRMDDKSWKKMKQYNSMDVILLEKVYDRFKGWHTTHPNINLKDSIRIYKCPVCAGTKVQQRGWSCLKTYKVKRFVCLSPTCGKWSYGEREKLEGKVLA